MNAAEKKAFSLRMKKAREAKQKTSKRKPAPKKQAKRPAAKKAKKAAKKRRRNPAETGDAMYERFHGRAPERTIEHRQKLSYRDEFAELGKLLELRFRLYGIAQPVPLREFGACQVTCTPDGKNIYLLGGNQKVDLSTLGIASDKDYVQLGECTYISYLTRKGFHHFEPIEYQHKFGEENGIRPVLAYDTVNRVLFLLGGDYQCRPEGIVN
jgi:hypothetical protein